MYLELIYTRCLRGFDIEKDLKPTGSGSGGFFLCGCSEAVVQEGVVDLPLLQSVLAFKNSYKEPNFMDDAYMYLTPDSGQNFMMNFHPIIVDKTATGSYAHRSGNYINQIFVGNFEDCYLYEYFGNTLIWDAQTRGEAYYYENDPKLLTPREKLYDMRGSTGSSGEVLDFAKKIRFEDVREFVVQGRREVLMRAVAFLIEQYALAPQERKYLVIHKAQEDEIELWIAAISWAFSPRMASGLSFATRMDDFSNTNKYTVDLKGDYQKHKNFQSPHQFLRYRAMIVGVDERERSSGATVRTLANLPYVVLDAKNKKLSVEMDISHPYYLYASAFDKNHCVWSEEFLQMVDLKEPSDAVLSLYNAYQYLLRYKQDARMEDLLHFVEVLKGYSLKNTPYLQGVYAMIRNRMPEHIQKEPLSGLSMMSWLEQVAKIVGDTMVREDFQEMVCKCYAQFVFFYPQDIETTQLQDAVFKSSFAQAVAAHLLSSELLDAMIQRAPSYDVSGWSALAKLLSQALRQIRSVRPALYKAGFEKVAQWIFSQSLGKMERLHAYEEAYKTVTIFCELNPDWTLELLLQETVRMQEKSGGQEEVDSLKRMYGVFLVNLSCSCLPQIYMSQQGLERFETQLKRHGIQECFSVALVFRAKSLKSMQDILKFLDWLHTGGKYEYLDLKELYEVLDAKLVLKDALADKVAASLQAFKPLKSICTRSAHRVVLDLMNHPKGVQELLYYFEKFVTQGFAGLEEEDYAEALMQKLFARAQGDAIFIKVVSAMSRSPYYSQKVVEQAMMLFGTKKNVLLGEVFEVACRAKSAVLDEALVRGCAKMKHFEKSSMAMRELLTSQETQFYFTKIERQAKELIKQNKTPSLFERFFSKRS